MRPPEEDWPINILEGAVRSGKTWSLHPKALYCSRYDIGGRKIFTGVSKQSIHNNVLHDLFEIVGSRNYNYNRTTGELRLFNSEWLVVGAKDEGSERYIRGYMEEPKFGACHPECLFPSFVALGDSCGIPATGVRPQNAGTI